MEYLSLIGTVTGIHLLAVISPGPDFFMACRNSLQYSRKTGVWTAVGFGAGIAVHIFYSLAGLAVIISQSILLFSIIKYVGAVYLIYIGCKSFFSHSTFLEPEAQCKRADISRMAAIKMGFLTNVLNPKATLFFLSLFTLIFPPNTPLPVMEFASAIMIFNTVLWFSLVAIFLTQERIRSIFERYQQAINKTLGGLLVALGMKVALTEQ